MHNTLNHLVKGNIDELLIDPTRIQLQGWSFLTSGKTCDVRLTEGNEPIMMLNKFNRPDVANHYGNGQIINCGWKVSIIPEEEIKNDLLLQCQIDGQWQTFFNLTDSFRRYNSIFNPHFSPEINSHNDKTFVVVDNFYKDPDAVRTFALSCQFNSHPDYHKGKRTDKLYKFPGLKESFEKILGRGIKNWDHYGTNGCFQYCIAGEQLVYHYDTQTYAGLLYLSPDAPPETGTSFYRSKSTKNMKVNNDYNKVFPTGHYDSTKFDLVDTVGNVYNRLVLFDAHLIHSASCYFGDTKENGRLFQLFFFDLE